MEPLSNYSRNIVIERSQILVSAIENYKMEFGVYPKTIQDLKPTYLKSIPSPNIMGVLNHRYNNINEQYAISFSQWQDFRSLEEIVLYDKANLHSVIDQYVKYDYSIDLHRVNGAFAVRNTRFDNWQYYHCD